MAQQWKIHIDETALRMCQIQATIFFWPVAALYRFGCVIHLMQCVCVCGGGGGGGRGGGGGGGGSA